jgi:hypothetical protein
MEREFGWDGFTGYGKERGVRDMVEGWVFFFFFFWGGGGGDRSALIPM